MLGSADRKRATCPLCGRDPAHGFKPFCGQGCRDRDLLNWLGDAYRLPGQPADPELVENVASGVDSTGRSSL